MTTLDPTIQRAIDDADLEREMEELLANKPTYKEGIRDPETGQAQALTSTAAEVKLWNRETGEESIVLFDALKARMNQRFPQDHPDQRFAGQRVYTRNQADVPQVVRGELACPLSPLHPDRSEAVALGFGAKVCKKPAYFMSPYDVDLHVEKSHKRFHLLRERARLEKLQKDNQQMQSQLTSALLKLAERETGETPRGTRGRTA